MTKSPGRFPAEVSIGLYPADLKTLVDDVFFPTWQSLDSTLVLTKIDQLEPLVITIRDVTQGNNTQVSEQPTSETFTGLEVMFTASIAQESTDLVERAFNTVYTPGAVPGTDPGLHRFSDKGGLTVGNCDELPYKVVVIRPFACGDEIDTDKENWYVMPWVNIKADATPNFGLQQQFSWTLTGTAFPNPDTGKDRLLRGDLSLLPIAEYPDP
jgi:hypothetical protein